MSLTGINVTVMDEHLTLCRPEWEVRSHVMSYFPGRRLFCRRARTIGCGSTFRRNQVLPLHPWGINGGIGTAFGKGTACQDILPFVIKVFVSHYHNHAVIPGTGIEYLISSSPRASFLSGRTRRKDHGAVCGRHVRVCQNAWVCGTCHGYASGTCRVHPDGRAAVIGGMVCFPRSRCVCTALR